MSSASVASHISSLQRVKVYRLRDGGKWDDQGTGHVAIDYIEGSKDLGLTVLDEDDNETLLLHNITSEDIYRKQEETIISWMDLEAATEFALSFQEAAGCSYIWDNICDIQRNLQFSNLGALEVGPIVKTTFPDLLQMGRRARSELERMLSDESAKPTALPLSLLEDITENFSNDREIGNGGFAVVYKGVLDNGMVAVNKLSETFIHEKKFIEEVRCLMKVKQKNIVRFLGYCYDTQGKMLDFEGRLVLAEVRQRLLCFEYLPKGSLDKQITDASCGLEWSKRYKIITGICDGLCYLHQKRILHLDLKPANILLDENMMPKIADFGLSRCFDEKQSQAITAKMIGTLGYLAPESFGGQITLKSDLYSLGMIILEILTGEKGYPDIDNVLDMWSNRLEESQRDTQLMQVRVCIEIAIECIEFNPAKRPNTQQIVDRLDATKSVDKFATETGSSSS